jgi:tetratricopeptide (TPR) repeat protein
VVRWYETADWDAAAQEDFEERLSRTRARPANRAEYLRRKGVELERAGLLYEAVRLYERFVAEEQANPFYVGWTIERLGDIARRSGQLADAERYYRQVLTTVGPHKSRSGMVEVSLAELLLDRGRPGEAAAALDDADMFSVTMFYANLFRYEVAQARIAQALGDTDAASAAAARALDLVGAPAQYSRHPGVGAVQIDDAIITMLRAMLPKAP